MPPAVVPDDFPYTDTVSPKNLVDGISFGAC